MHNYTYVSILMGYILLSAAIFCQAEKPLDIPLTSTQKEELIDRVCEALIEHYIFEDKAQMLAAHIQRSFSQGAYDRHKTAISFTAALEEDLAAVSNDKHLGIVYDPAWASRLEAQEKDNSEEAKAARKKEFEAERLRNFGFVKIEILPGNIGYLDLRLFPNPEFGSETAVAAMNFLANTDAVIFDLRHNGGGWGEMVMLLCSYFIKDRTELSGIRFRKDNKLEQAWTLPYVPGKRLSDRDLYLITSSRTFSAAEDFAYSLKAVDRATIVGERTKGGAHPIEYFILFNEYVLIVPNATSFNPHTKGNWEGTGIEPHIACAQQVAFDKAYRIALERLLEKQEDEARRYPLRWALEGLEAKSHPVTVGDHILKKYAGNYGERQVVYEDGTLYYIRQIRYELLPLSETVFMFKDAEDIRVSFVLNDRNQVEEMRILFMDGSQLAVKKSSNSQVE